MKKLIALTLLLCTFALMFSSCGNNAKIKKPEDTNLEYWLLDILDTDNATLLEVQPTSNLYLDSKYEPVVDENGNLCKPEHYVVYYMSNYPLLDLPITKKISRIEITDPEVNLWGLTIHSHREEIIAALENNGFVVTSNDHTGVTGDNGRYGVTVRFNEAIYIRYEMPSIIAALWSIDFD